MEAKRSRSFRPNEPLNIGDRYIVQRSNKQWHLAKIIHFRTFCSEFEYLVHYEGCNRRLDEWVSREQIVTFFPNQDTLTNQNQQIKIPSTRKLRNRTDDEISHGQETNDDMDPTTVALEKEFEESTKVKFIEHIQFGDFEIRTWYFSPFPDEYRELRKLWICEYCLKYMKFPGTFMRHIDECKHRGPPGEAIYCKGTLSVHEVDGENHKLSSYRELNFSDLTIIVGACKAFPNYKLYCQFLCLMAKLFLDHKTLYYNVECFKFYVVTEADEHGSHLVGYFSKEKGSTGNNISCILTLPPYQKQGYGNFLIAFSYELSKIEKLIGGPEKPLSDLGSRAYRSYWSWVLLEILRTKEGRITIKELSRMTSIAEPDIRYTLQKLKLCKYYKGEHFVCATPKLIEEQLQSLHGRKPKITVDVKFLKWNPPQKTKNKHIS